MITEASMHARYKRVVVVNERTDAVWASSASRRFKAFRQMLSRIGRKKGQMKRAEIHRALKSFDSKFVAAIFGHPRGAPPLTFEALLRRAERVELNRPTGCQARIKWQQKDVGERLTFDFSPERRAAQWLVAQITEAAMGHSDFEFARRGRGAGAAIRQIREVLETKGGPKWFSKYDVVECYRSITREHIYEILPIARAIIDNTIFLPHEEEELIATQSPKAVPIGLPQGSLASNIVAAKLIEKIIDPLCGFPKIVHGDDILIGHQNEEDAHEVLGAASLLFEDRPAGPLKVKAQVVKFGRLFEFLGYKFKKIPARFGGGVRAVPSKKSFARFERRMLDALLAAPAGELFQKERTYRQQWISSFPEWDCSLSGKELVEIMVAAHLVPIAIHKRKSLYGYAT